MLGGLASKLDLAQSLLSTMPESLKSGFESFDIARTMIDVLLQQTDYQLLVRRTESKIKPFGIQEVLGVMGARILKFQMDRESLPTENYNYEQESEEPVAAQADFACSNSDNLFGDRKAVQERIRIRNNSNVTKDQLMSSFTKRFSNMMKTMRKTQQTKQDEP